jgi:hypothetical protein
LLARVPGKIQNRDASEDSSNRTERGTPDALERRSVGTAPGAERRDDHHDSPQEPPHEYKPGVGTSVLAYSNQSTSYFQMKRRGKQAQAKRKGTFPQPPQRRLGGARGRDTTAQAPRRRAVAAAAKPGEKPPSGERNSDDGTAPFSHRGKRMRTGRRQARGGKKGHGTGIVVFCFGMGMQYKSGEQGGKL